MNKKQLLKLGYREYSQTDDEPTLYQKKITDKEGIKYFIDCYHYNFPKQDTWEFKLQTSSKLGTINVALFNTDLTIKKIEQFIEKAWIQFGSNYYELFASGRNDDGN